MNEDLVIRGVANDDELCEANDLMERVHFLSGSPGALWLRDSAATYPGFQREHTRAAYYRGQLAGALRITTDTIRIGEARLKMGGLGCVTTADRFRHRGIARELLTASMRFMESRGYHVSMLFGIPNFYHRFGFATSLAEYATSIAVREALEVPSPAYKARMGKPGDIRAVQKMHESNDFETACSLVRDAAHITNLWHRWQNLWVLMDEKGRVGAYFVPQANGDELEIVETGLCDFSWCPAVLNACARHAHETCCARLRFLGPPELPLIQYLLQFRSTHETRISRGEGGMMAFALLGEALESMLPEWEYRLRSTELAERNVEITLIPDRKPFRVRAHRGAIAITPGIGANKIGLSQAELMHLLTGYRYAEEILSSERRMLTQEARAMACAIFPKRHAYVWHNDRF